MEDAIRLIITVLFIGLVVLTIIFFGIFGIAPLTRLNAVLKQPAQSTSSVTFPSGQGAAQTSPATPAPVTESPQTNVENPAGTPPEPQNGGASSGGAVTSPGPVTFIDQSAPMQESKLPSGAKILTVSANGFMPPVLTVAAGSVFTIALISGVDETHVLKFYYPSLSAIGIGVGPHEARTITLSIPNPGSYPFHCDVPGHASRGEVGKIVAQ